MYSLNSHGYLQVPQSIDQSEDEGFQSASNLTPDSQSEPSMTPDIDLWDAVLTYGPSKRRCWERIGWYVSDVKMKKNCMLMYGLYVF